MDETLEDKEDKSINKKDNNYIESQEVAITVGEDNMDKDKVDNEDIEDVQMEDEEDEPKPSTSKEVNKKFSFKSLI
uniref:Uncharacterized protein n=1 Tax=Panagrolaimus sp. ES5 TaxID=591445 RepID=A0AC34G6U5_9BILA